jgi:hypothetical protein
VPNLHKPGRPPPSPPFRLLEVARGYLAEAEGLEAANLLLVDHRQELLSPFGAYQGRRWGRSGSTSERFGVLDVRLATEATRRQTR